MAIGKTRMAGGRPRKTLLERVVANSFRPRRYGHLLAGELLPAEPPRGLRAPYKRRIWAKLVDWQKEWQLYVADGSSHGRRQAPIVAAEFAALVRHLHGDRGPDWF